MRLLRKERRGSPELDGLCSRRVRRTRQYPHIRQRLLISPVNIATSYSQHFKNLKNTFSVHFIQNILKLPDMARYIKRARGRDIHGRYATLMSQMKIHFIAQYSRIYHYGAIYRLPRNILKLPDMARYIKRARGRDIHGRYATLMSQTKIHFIAQYSDISCEYRDFVLSVYHVISIHS